MQAKVDLAATLARDGRLPEAAMRYRSVINALPDVAGLQHNLGAVRATLSRSSFAAHCHWGLFPRVLH